MNEIREWVEENRSDWLNDSMNLIRMKSVSAPGSHPIYPYGEDCARVLEAALDVAKKMGFETENHEYHCGSILLRGETEEEIGIFNHLDVVHEGSGWATPPYEPFEKDGWLYGRGSQDNKAPAMASLYVLKYLKEHHIRLKHTIRLYFGCSEELGMHDLIYYTKHYQAPTFSFVPDAPFSVCYAEKGILEAEYSRKLDGEILEAFDAGVSGNAVPGLANAKLNIADYELIENYVKNLKNMEDFVLDFQKSQVTITAKGRSAHAAFPEGSDSAAVKLAKMLRKAPFLDQKSKDCLKYIEKGFEDYHGEGMNVACQDELSGCLTLIGGMVRTKDGTMIQNINIRYPVTTDTEWLIAGIRKAAEYYGWKEEYVDNNAASVMDPNDEKIKIMYEMFNQVFGMDCPPYSMGGGTYARKLPNAVGYGPHLAVIDRPTPPGHGKSHQPDECTHIESILRAMEVYIRVIPKLDELV